jgi:hypothetical protein
VDRRIDDAAPFCFPKTLNPTHEPTMQAHPPHPIDARPAAAAAKAGVEPSCASTSRGWAVVGLGGLGIMRRIGGSGEVGWNRRERYKQRGRTVVRA